METEVVDTYIHKDKRERLHFEIVNEELWEFLSKRYGFDQTIKRHYISKGSYYSLCEVELRHTLIPVYMARAEDLYAGRCDEESFKISFVQICGNKSFSELKKRIADVITAQV